MDEVQTEYCYTQSIPYTEKSVEFQKFHDKNDESSSHSESYILSYTKRKNIDHAGFRLTFESPESNYTFSFHDKRHWNREEERWYYEGEQIKQYLESVDDDYYRTKYLDEWLDRYNLRNYLKKEYGHTSLKLVIGDLREQNIKNPYLHVFEQLFPKI